LCKTTPLLGPSFVKNAGPKLNNTPVIAMAVLGRLKSDTDEHASSNPYRPYDSEAAVFLLLG
jgi:hypothetical protein